MADSYEGHKMIIVDQNGKLHDPDFDRIWLLTDYQQFIVIVREIPNNESETSKRSHQLKILSFCIMNRLSVLGFEVNIRSNWAGKSFEVIESNKETIEELLLTNVLLSSNTILHLDRFPELKRFSFQNKL